MAKSVPSWQRPVTGRMFWVEWVAANAIGGAVSWALFASVYGLMIGVFGGANEGMAFRAVSGALTWAVVYTLIGAAQWMLVRQAVRWSGLWVVAGAAGGITFGIVAELVFAAQGGTEVGAIAGAAAGLVSGVIQGVLLQRSLPYAVWWLPASTAAGLVAAATGWAIIAPLLQGFGRAGSVALAWAIAGALGNAAGGAISGGVLVWLMQALAVRQPLADD